MTHLLGEIRPGAYADSVVLMQLQRDLTQLPGVLDAAVVMGSEANLDLLRASELMTPVVANASSNDLVIVVASEDRTLAQDALARVDDLLLRKSDGAETAYRSRSLRAAARLLPQAGWVLVSTPGRWAAEVAHEALDLGKHVFLYSDNVPIAEEVELKAKAAAAGLLVMGPDCGTAIVHGTGLGFANRVRRGRIGIVAASGTGLQAISCRVHELGAGISHAVGTGGRDLSGQVGGVTAIQALELLADDPETSVIVVVSKPPARVIAARLLAVARRIAKPVVICFQGQANPASQIANLHFAANLDEAAERAVATLQDSAVDASRGPHQIASSAPKERRYLRGLFAGGTLAKEAQLTLRPFLSPLFSSDPIDGVERLEEITVSTQNTILDLGDDEFTVGRLHPMMDQDLRIRRFRQEAADPTVASILIDVVLGDGAHPDPAVELAPAITEACAQPGLSVLAIVIGTDEDPQDLDRQVEVLSRAGARVFRKSSTALAEIVEMSSDSADLHLPPPVDPRSLSQSVVAINVGIEVLYSALQAQDVPVVQVDWRPPAAGNEKLAAILERMKG